MTDDDISRFQDVFETLLANSDGNGRIPTLFFESVMLSGLGDLVYVEDVPRRMIARGGVTRDVTASRPWLQIDLEPAASADVRRIPKQWPSSCRPYSRTR